MKISLCLLAALLLGYGVQAQPVINSADYTPTADTAYAYKYGTIQVDPGAAGADVTWDFSGVSLTSDNTFTTYVCPGAGECSNFAGTTEYVVTGVGGTIFYQRTATDYLELGIVNNSGDATTYSPSNKIMQFPMSYQQTFNGTYTVTMTQSGTTLTQNGTYTSEVDGYGTLITPEGSFSDVLRQKKVDVLTYATGGITSTMTITRYGWFKAGVNQPLMTVIITEITFSGGVPGPPTSYVASYLTGVPTGIPDVAQRNQAAAIYPNPVTAGQPLHVSVANDGITSIVLTNILGQELFQWKSADQPLQQKNILLPATLARGMYLLTVRTIEGSLTRKVRVQ